MEPNRFPPLLEFAAAYSRRVLLVVAGALVVGYVVVQLSTVVLPVLIALLLTALLWPLVDALRRRGVPNALAAGGVLVVFLLAIVTVFAWVGPSAVSQFDDLRVGIQRGIGRLTTLLSESPLDVSAADVRERIDRGVEEIRQNLGGLAGRVASGAAWVLNLVAGAVLALFLLFFFLKDGRRMSDWLVHLVRPHWQDDARELGRRSFGVLGAYARGVVLVAVVDAVFIGLALLLIGVPLVLPLAVLTFFGAFFPIVGAVTAGALAVLVALVSNGLSAAVLVVVAVLVVQQVESNVLYPFLVGSSLGLHPVAMLLVLTAGSVLAGIVGALFAVPVAAVVGTAASFIRERARESGTSVEAEPG
jgi:predicted PurR-regulated permease PerM